MAAFGSHDSCPNCGARMAADQRYCLNCGHRRGEPRLPFMDAVVFMETMSAPPGGTPPPPPAPSSGGSSPRMNANAALIAGVATLVLAIGVGFLIGRAGHDGSNSAAEAPIKVIEVGGGGGGGEATETASTEGASETTKESSKAKGANDSGGGAKKSAKASPKTQENAETGAHGASKATEEVLHTEGDVEFAEPEQKVGGACKEGAAGCEGGEFTGNFFGE
jgi:hypothetical protein